MMRDPSKALLAILGLTALPGCPESWGFYADVYATKGEYPQVLVVAPSSGQPTTDSLVPIADAEIRCEGCEKDAIRKDASGRFFVSLGGGYRHPKPVVLHVTAQGYAPVDFEVREVPIQSQLGWATFVIVLQPSPR